VRGFGSRLFPKYRTHLKIRTRDNIQKNKIVQLSLSPVYLNREIITTCGQNAESLLLKAVRTFATGISAVNIPNLGLHIHMLYSVY
jgi:hypothetical protein